MPAAGSIVDSFHRIGFQSPGDSTQTPFYFKQNMGVFEWLKVNPSQRQNFDQYMAGRSKVAVRWFDIFLMPEQVSQSQSSVLLVDVGGGLGDNVSAFRKNHASLKGRLVLQDLPETIDSISKESLEGIEAMAYNFFTPQPIQGESYLANFDPSAKLVIFFEMLDTTFSAPSAMTGLTTNVSSSSPTL